MQQNLETCEICGKHSRLVDAIIEGSILSVCNNCLQYGEAVEIPKEKEKIRKVSRKTKIPEEQELITGDYASLIKEARERLGLKQKELAEKIVEKESVIHSLESGNLKPAFTLARKLEKFLKIKLIEIYSAPEKNKIDFSDTSLTIGDLLKLKKK